MSEPGAVTREEITGLIHAAFCTFGIGSHEELCPFHDEPLADAILALFAHRDVEVTALRGQLDRWENTAEGWLRESIRLGEQVRALTKENAELRGPLTTKVRAADVVMKAIDDAVACHYIDSRSRIADARLDYGDPLKYTDDTLRARAESAEKVVSELSVTAITEASKRRTAERALGEARTALREILTVADSGPAHWRIAEICHSVFDGVQVVRQPAQVADLAVTECQHWSGDAACRRCIVSALTTEKAPSDG